MKDNIVFWGANEKDEKILVALRLRAADKKVDIWTFDEKICKKEFVDSMFADWDKLDISSFPKDHVFIERDASSPELLPAQIKTSTPENADLISRAEREWTVKVLSLRLYEMIRSEVLALKEQVMSLTAYDKGSWDSCKAYWDKIMTNHNDRNLNREQASELREVVNTSFERLKELMADTNKQYEEESQANFFQITKKIDELQADFEKNPNKAKSTFNELRKLQGNMKDLRLNRSAYKDIRSKMNKAFEAVKKGMAQSNLGHFEKRVKGLKSAIDKMQKSIDWDRGSIDFQNKRSNSVHAGQLEMQLRDAKIKMINARIESKQAKLDDMTKTLATLEKKLKKAAPKEKPAAKNENQSEKKGQKADEKKIEDKKADEKKADEKKADGKKADEKKAVSDMTAPENSKPKDKTGRADAAKDAGAAVTASKSPETNKKEGDPVKSEDASTKEAMTEKTKEVTAEKSKPEKPKVEQKIKDTTAEQSVVEEPKVESKAEKPKSESAIKAVPMTTAEMTRRALNKNAGKDARQEEE